MKSAPTIAFDYRPSRLIASATLIVAVLAAWMPWYTALPTAARVAASLAIAVYAAHRLRAFLEPRIRRIARTATGWRLVDAGDAERAADLVAHARTGAWLTLDFRTLDGRRRRVVLGPDNADADLRRRLVLLLARGEVAQSA